MRTYYKPKDIFYINYGTTYECNHPVYNRCTLFKIKTKGIAVIQQRYDLITKHTWWSEIDDCLRDDLYLNSNFYEFFKSNATAQNNGFYPTFTIRQIMHRLKMEPLKKEVWETVFDHTRI